MGLGVPVGASVAGAGVGKIGDGATVATGASVMIFGAEMLGVIDAVFAGVSAEIGLLEYASASDVANGTDVVASKSEESGDAAMDEETSSARSGVAVCEAADSLSGSLFTEHEAKASAAKTIVIRKTIYLFISNLTLAYR